MKKLVFLLSSIACLSASAAKFNCIVSHNNSEVFNDSVKVHEDERSNHFFSAEQFKFFMSQKSKDEFELEVLDLTTPSRSYAKSKVKKSADIIEYALWSRKELLEVKCELL